MQIAANFGEIVLDLAPAEGNPRNSEGAFLSLPDGRILYVYSRFKGKDLFDYAAADIWMLTSRDGGRTFGESREVLTREGENAVNIMSLSLMEMANGDVGLFYLVRTTYSLMRMYLRRSSDGGQTFGERVLCTPQEGFFVVNNDRVTRLSSGRILIPAACHRKGFCASPDEEGDGFIDTRSEDLFFYSDDDGRTWLTAPGKCALTGFASCKSGLQEPGILELSPGLLWGWARTDLGRQYEMLSPDKGETWTPPVPSRFSSPNSPLCAKRGPDGGIYVIWNPIPSYNGRSETFDGVWHGGRNPLAISVSRDNGQSFTQPLAFETDERSGYCYCAIYFTSDFLLLAYCAGNVEDKSCLARTRIRRIPLSQLNEALSGLPLGL